MFLRLLPLLLMFSLLQAGLPPGRPLPDVPIARPDGRNIDLKQYRGKAVVLMIFGTTCADCYETLALLDRMQGQYAPQGLQVVAAASEPNAASALTVWFKRNNKPYPVGYLEVAPYQKIANTKPNAPGHLPVLLFIDPKGMVRVQLFGDDPLMKKPELVMRRTIEELLKEVPQAASSAKR